MLICVFLGAPQRIEEHRIEWDGRSWVRLSVTMNIFLDDRLEDQSELSTTHLYGWRDRRTAPPWIWGRGHGVMERDREGHKAYGGALEQYEQILRYDRSQVMVLLRKSPYSTVV